jgi:hypothetical protein
MFYLYNPTADVHYMLLISIIIPVDIYVMIHLDTHKLKYCVLKRMYILKIQLQKLAQISCSVVSKLRAVLD